jgi:hypothetical protein
MFSYKWSTVLPLKPEMDSLIQYASQESTFQEVKQNRKIFSRLASHFYSRYRFVRPLALAVSSLIHF